MAKLHSIVRAAGRKREFPAWAEVSRPRREHSERVGRLMRKWARGLELDKTEQARWRAAGILHDALKDADTVKLREALGSEAAEWPDPLLHGPACAARLRAEGVDDEPLLLAIAHHTTGHPAFERIGEALYLADYLEPGRRRLAERRGAWRKRMPDGWADVLVEVTASKIGILLERHLSLPPVTVQFWERALRR